MTEQAIYRISIDHEDVQFDVVYKLLSESYWSTNIRPEVLREAIANSVVAGAFDEETGKQVAFARVVTDYATFGWLCDVIVHPDHQARGLAKRMLAALHKHPRLQTLRRWMLATKSAHTLYEPMGYKFVEEHRWMERLMPKSAWQKAPE